MSNRLSVQAADAACTCLLVWSCNLKMYADKTTMMRAEFSVVLQINDRRLRDDIHLALNLVTFASTNRLSVSLRGLNKIVVLFSLIL